VDLTETNGRDGDDGHVKGVGKIPTFDCDETDGSEYRPKDEHSDAQAKPVPPPPYHRVVIPPSLLH
jgi:hypothetical protein